MGRAHTYRPKFGYDIRIKPEARPHPEAARRCAVPGCGMPGLHRAPRDRDHLAEHQWLCVDHVRAHNQGWDYFAGMSEAEIEAFRAAALTGHRPTWPVGNRSWREAPYARRGPYSFVDGFAIFEDAAKPARPKTQPLTKLQLAALETLSLDAGATLHDIKARYKELVKRFHPDANGGDRGAEERLKQVIKAYSLLRATGLA